MTRLHGGRELLQHDFTRSRANQRGTARRLTEGGVTTPCADADMAGAVLPDPVATATFADDLVDVGLGARSTPVDAEGENTRALAASACGSPRPDRIEALRWLAARWVADARAGPAAGATRRDALDLPARTGATPLTDPAPR